MAGCNRRRRFRFNLLLALSFLLFAISALEGTARSQPSGLPAAAGAAVDLEGDFVIIHQDFKHSGRYLYFLNTPSGQVSLHFNSKAPTNLLTGDHVRAHGTVGTSGTLILASGGSVTTTSTTTTSSTAPLPYTFGAQKTLVILVNFTDNTSQPWTPAQAQSAVFSTGSNFFLENSYGQTWLTGDVVGWYTMPLSSTSCDTSQISTDARSAASAAGVNLANYTRYVYAFPHDSACYFSGMGTVGGNPSEAWFNGTIDTGTVTHEMGHNFGLYHSHAWACGSTIIGPSGCTSIEYGDTLDTMGGFGDYNSFQKERLGWLNYGASPPIATVGASASYTIDPYELADSNTKALRILKSVDPVTGLRTWYYVEFREPIGFDSAILSLAIQNFTQGVVVHIGTDSTPNSSELLDMTPGSSTLYDWDDPALVVGKSFSDPSAGVTIATDWANSSNAGVTVTLTTPCTRGNPTVAISPASSAPASAGTPVTFTVSVTNNDNSVCTASNFNLAVNVASGWSAAFGSSAFTLNPGASAATSLTVTSASSAAAGPYSAGVSAQNATASGYTGSASATDEVAPSIAVSTNSSSYNQGNSVYVTTVVKSGGSSVPDTSVNCTVTGPNNTKMSATATTGTDGTTSVTFKLKRSAPPGIYQALSVAAANGVSGSGATNFTVQ